jgi:hypothetical protein
MTIKQIGGVFGRNPTFNDVVVDDEITVNGSADINGNADISGTLSFPDLSIVGTGNAIYTNTTGAAFFRSSQMLFQNAAGTVGYATLNSNGIVIPNGLGIDFSATSGTGTSELFDDYEEGTFTYTLPCSTSGSYNVRSGYTTGYYTKIGRVVSISLRFESQGSSSPVGNLQLAGLPFTTASSPALGTAQTFIPLLVRGTTGTIASFYFTFGGGVTTGTFAKQGTDGAYSTLSVSDIPTNVEGSLSFTYETA